MKKVIESFPLKPSFSKITIRLDEDLKKRLSKAIMQLKKQNPEMKVSVNELIKQLISDFLETA